MLLQFSSVETEVNFSLCHNYLSKTSHIH